MLTSARISKFPQRSSGDMEAGKTSALVRRLVGGHQKREGGQPLDAPTRGFMESRFGHDFSKVKIHSDGQAADLARALDARAFVAGQDLVFGAGQYAPETSAGKQLLAHELAHVVQAQSPAPFGALKLISQRSDTAEHEARQAAGAVAAGRSFQIREAPSAMLHRAEPAAEAAPKTDWWDFEPEILNIKAQKPENEKQAEKLRKLVWLMARPSHSPIERNTAKRIRDGEVTVRLIDDLELYPDQEKWIREHFDANEVSRKMATGRVLVHPRMGPVYVPNDANGIEVPDDPLSEIFMRGKGDQPLIITQLIHESSHELNPPEAQRFQDPMMQLAWEKFVTETRAYYVADYRDLEGTMLDYPNWQLGDSGPRYALADYHEPAPGQLGERRLAVAKLMAVLTYPLVQKYFDSDVTFKAALRTWQLTGNIDNSPLTP